MPTSTAAVQSYLHEALAIPAVSASVWAQANKLPYFLQDSFTFSTIELLGQPVVFAVGRAEQKPSPGEIGGWLNQIRMVAGLPVVYVTDALTFYDRKRLIEQKVSFVVPGNQLYLPDLGLDLREHFRQRAAAVTAALSPSTQAMLIAALLRQPWQAEWQPSTVAVALGYTPMTLSRVVRELTGTDLATVNTVGRTRWLHMAPTPALVWEKAKPMLRTPVKRTVWVVPGAAAAKVPRRLTGLSALAQLSMLAEPKWPVYALGATEWKAAIEAGAHELPEPLSEAQEWQVWSYSPALLPDATTVDPLSLMLSLKDHTDDRVRIALDELKEHLPW